MRRLKSSRLTYTCASVLCALIASGCGGDSDEGAQDGEANGQRTSAGPVSAAALDRARSFKKFRLFYLGETFQGLPLTDITYPHRSDPPPTVTFFYGDCEPPEDEGGCALPISVGISSICDTHFPTPDRNDPLGPEEGKPRGRLTTVRGVPARDYSDRRADDHLEIYTGEVTVDIFTEGVRAREAAKGLRSLDGRIKPSSNLPAPPKGTRAGKPEGCSPRGRHQ